MAPEQIEALEADARTDIFAFGAVLYEMLTGAKAFDGKSAASLTAAILERQPAPIREQQPLVSEQLEHVIVRCLEKDPELRSTALLMSPPSCDGLSIIRRCLF
jgi:eukaryotic-like serine/threonine-protein kinase